MKKSLIKKISLGLTCLLGVGGLFGAIGASNNVEVKEASAASAVLWKTFTFSDTYLNNVAAPAATTTDTYWITWQREGDGNTAAIENGALHMHVVEPGGRNFFELHYRIPSTVEICKIEVDAIPGLGTDNVGGKNQNFSIKGNLDGEYSKRQYLNKAGSSSVTSKTTYTFTPKEADGTAILNHIQLDLGTGTKNRNTQYTFDTYFWEMRLYQAVYTSPVTIAKGTGVKSVYLSTNSSATSGSASGSEFDTGTTVYGFVELAKGYKSKSGWTKVSGTADTEGAKYRVGSVKAGTSNFGTVSADRATYTISYTLNGGTHGATHPTSYNIDTATFTISNPTRTGYTFKGWSGTGLSGDTNKNIQVAKGSIGNRSYTANWTANQYKVQYNGNKPANAPTDVSGVPAQATWTYDSNATLGSAPTLTGYTFDGWYKEAACTNKVGNANQQLTKPNLTATKDATVNLYAKWKFNSDVQNVVDKINAIGSVSYPTSKSNIETAEAAYEALSADLKAVVDANGYNTTLSNARTSYDTQKDTAVQAVIDAIDAIGDIEYPTDLNAIQNARTLYNGLDEDEQNIETIPNYEDLTHAEEVYEHVDAVYILISHIGFVDLTDACKDRIDAARDGYDALSNEEKALVINYQTLLDAEEKYGNAKEVYDAIENIGELAVSEECKERIDTARTLYNALTPEEKEIVSNYNVLTHAEVTYEHAKAVVDLIDAINPLEHTQECLNRIEEAREAYNALTNEEKSLVYNYSDLPHSEIVYSHVDYCYNLIEDLGDIEYNDFFKEKLDIARNYYDGLTDEEKALVTNYSTLTHDEEVYSHVDAVVNAIRGIDYNELEISPECEEMLKNIRESYNNLTDEEKLYVINIQDLDRVEEHYANAKAVYDEIQDLLDHPSVSDEFIEKVQTALDHYNALNEEYEKPLVTNVFELQNLVQEIDNAKEVIALINNLPDPVISNEYKEKLDEARDAYNALNSTEKGMVDNYDELVHREEVYENAKNVIALINNIGEVDLSDDCEERIEAARDAYNALTNEEKALITNYNTLTHDEGVVEHATNAINLINNIGEVDASEEAKERIDNAREVYDALSPEEKALVNNLNVLTAAEEKYGRIKNVIDLINNIGDLKVSEGCEALINTAREAYNALSEDEQALITNYNVLTHDEQVYGNAKTVVDEIEAIGQISYTDECKAKMDHAQGSYNALTSEEKALVYNYGKLTKGEEQYAHVGEAIETIETIGQVELTEESKERIEEAQKAYDSLSEEEKTMVPSSNVDHFNHAVEEYKELKAKHDMAFILILIGSIVCVSVFIFFLIFLIAKRRKKDKDEEEPAKK